MRPDPKIQLRKLPNTRINRDTKRKRSLPWIITQNAQTAKKATRQFSCLKSSWMKKHVNMCHISFHYTSYSPPRTTFLGYSERRWSSLSFHIWFNNYSQVIAEKTPEECTAQLRLRRQSSPSSERRQIHLPFIQLPIPTRLFRWLCCGLGRVRV